ncbi:MAG: NUDIX hydrolase [Streptosporangiales bacterium]|nr:NUDIX hydrolase [Streptosporangiales bacterium]
MSTRIPLNKLKDGIADRVAGIAEGRIAPAEVRQASTVMILRDGPEVLMMKRPAAMSFAAGAYVFPGGRVDPADADPSIGWHGPAPSAFAARLGAPDEDVARALVCAAIRETFEEAGLLLAGAPDGPVTVPSGEAWEADRAELIAGTTTFGELLARRGLALRADLLVPWARWITPEAEPKRYDTRFFVTRLPAGQEATGHAAEADRLAWVNPADGLRAARDHEMFLMPPTATTLNEFARLGDVGAILGEERSIVPIQPRIVAEDGQPWLEIPPEADFPDGVPR